VSPTRQTLQYPRSGGCPRANPPCGRNERDRDRHAGCFAPGSLTLVLGEASFDLVCVESDATTPATLDDNLPPLTFPAVEHKKVIAAFNGGRMTGL
jgi:hypothetical protein